MLGISVFLATRALIFTIRLFLPETGAISLLFAGIYGFLYAALAIFTAGSASFLGTRFFLF